jgi:hypothetical protein
MLAHGRRTSRIRFRDEATDRFLTTIRETPRLRLAHRREGETILESMI